VARTAGSYTSSVPGTPAGDDADRLPEWFMPPPMTGGHVTGPLLITRSGRFVVAVRHVVAFPAGVEVEAEAHSRGTAPGSDDVTGLPELRFRVLLADGRVAVQDDEAGLRNGAGPMLKVTGFEGSSGGPGGDEHVRMSVWLWPLPPPGPVTVTCSWPGRGLQDASIVLDGDAIRAAATQALPFWTSPDA
jgi:hypothetical protein